MRTFIAIELPEKTKAELGNIQEELKLTGADVKWVKPENIHLTLKFLGEIDKGLLKKISSILIEISSRNKYFNICLSKLGVFPNLKYPRVIWIGLNDNQQVVDIAEALEKQLIRIGLPAESRPFTAHITLGRIRSHRNHKKLIEKLELINKDLSYWSDFKVSRLILFKSTLTPQGPIYESLFSCPLANL